MCVYQGQSVGVSTAATNIYTTVNRTSITCEFQSNSNRTRTHLHIYKQAYVCKHERVNGGKLLALPYMLVSYVMNCQASHFELSFPFFFIHLFFLVLLNIISPLHGTILKSSSKPKVPTNTIEWVQRHHKLTQCNVTQNSAPTNTRAHHYLLLTREKGERLQTYAIRPKVHKWRQATKSVLIGDWVYA